ncbi:MAG: DMT family transporter [Paraglaciecola sp.]|uniref:DMT family transporter n=1 Tax=Paraglaciecola sp. TaxID=1920173 RepID=UPI0032669DBD
MQINRVMLTAICSVLFAMVAIQSGASLAKQLFPLVGPEGTTALRLGFAAAVLWVVFRPWRAMPQGREWQSVIIYGLCLGGMNILFYLAIERIPLGIAVALEFTGPLAVALFSSKRKSDLLWVAFAIAGIVLLLPDLASTQGLDLTGALMALGAGAFWAGYILFGTRSGKQVSGGMTVAFGMTVAAIVLVPVGAVSHGLALVSWEVLSIGLLVGILSSALPYSLEMIALRNMPTQAFSVLMSLEPAIGALAGFVLLSEQLTLLQWVAIGLVIVASIGSSFTPKKAVEMGV